jgi:DNA-binding PadR family transcriptional regulator
VLRDFFLGFIKIHILYHAAQEPLYGVALIAELARHGYELSPGTLYPLLHSLHEAGYLAREDRVIGGKIRKYYLITDAGRRMLEETKPKIAELVAEVLEGHGPSRRVARKELNPAARKPVTRPRQRSENYDSTAHS